MPWSALNCIASWRTVIILRNTVSGAITRVTTACGRNDVRENIVYVLLEAALASLVRNNPTAPILSPVHLQNMRSRLFKALQKLSLRSSRYNERVTLLEFLPIDSSSIFIYGAPIYLSFFLSFLLLLQKMKNTTSPEFFLKNMQPEKPG